MFELGTLEFKKTTANIVGQGLESVMRFGSTINILSFGEVLYHMY